MNSDFPRIITLLRKERGISQKHGRPGIYHGKLHDSVGVVYGKGSCLGRAVI